MAVSPVCSFRSAKPLGGRDCDGRPRHCQGQQDHRQASERQQKKIFKLDPTGTHNQSPAQKLHRRPMHATTKPIEQVDDGDQDPGHSNQKSRLQKSHRPLIPPQARRFRRRSCGGTMRCCRRLGHQNGVSQKDHARKSHSFVEINLYRQLVSLRQLYG